MRPAIDPEVAQRAMFEVAAPGLLTTVQDAGRPASMPLGVPRSGACDPLALAAANLLVGNAPDAAVLEVNLLGPELVAREPAFVALAGANCEAVIAPAGTLLAPGEARHVAAGDRVVFGAALDGARACVAIAGGFDVPHMLGSASTSLVGGFGGVEGRPLHTGDLLVGGVPARSLARFQDRSWPGPSRSSGVPDGDQVELRVIRGPHAELESGSAWRWLVGTTWEVDPRSDRVGVRFRSAGSGPDARHEPDPPDGQRHAPGNGLVSLPMVWGAIELPEGGAPIALLADHPTVGGYPVVGVVASADLPILGQLRPGHRATFRPISLAEAEDAAAAAEGALAEAQARLQARSADG